MLWARSHEKLRSIGDMQQVPQHMLGESGEPLFSDMELDEYLAPKYLARDLDALKDYGFC